MSSDLAKDDDNGRANEADEDNQRSGIGWKEILGMTEQPISEDVKVPSPPITIKDTPFKDIPFNSISGNITYRDPFSQQLEFSYHVKHGEAVKATNSYFKAHLQWELLGRTSSGKLEVSQPSEIEEALILRHYQEPEVLMQHIVGIPMTKARYIKDPASFYERAWRILRSSKHGPTAKEEVPYWLAFCIRYWVTPLNPWLGFPPVCLWTTEAMNRIFAGPDPSRNMGEDAIKQAIRRKGLYRPREPRYTVERINGSASWPEFSNFDWRWQVRRQK